MRRIATLAVLAIGCGGNNTAKQEPSVAPAPAVEQSFRAQPPAPGPTPELVAPVPTKTVLDNGLTVLTYQKKGLPLVYVEVAVKAGSAADPEALPGLAGFTADMLKQGTKTRSASQIAEEVETLGSGIGVEVDEDSTSVSFSALAQNFAPVFDVAADVLLNPAFANEEVERSRKRRLGSLAEVRDDPHSAVWRVFKRTIFGDTPYGHTVIGEEKAIAKISAKDLRGFYDKVYAPANAAIVVVGDVSDADAVAEVKKRLGGWKPAKGAAPTTPPKAPEPNDAALVLVNKRDAPQSQLNIGHLGVPRDHPDYFSLVLCNAILGGQFNSRINMNLREDKGYTYGARSQFEFWRGAGPFVVSTAVRTDVTAPAIQEVLKEIDHMRASDVTPEELSNAKSRYSLSLPGYFQTVGAIGSMFSGLYLFNLPLDYYQRLPENIAKVTVADVRRVAEQHLKPQALSIVVVGDKQKVISALGDLQRGAVELRDADGHAAD
jgi:zinc protease